MFMLLMPVSKNSLTFKSQNLLCPLPIAYTGCKIFSHTMHLDIIKVFYLPTDAQENCFKRNIKIYIKTAPTCFGLITIIRERAI